MEIQICLRPDSSERVNYNAADFPAYIDRCELSSYPNYAGASHWHEDVELIAVCAGHMLYNINGEVVTLAEGDGIFVNARQLHFGFSDNRSDCTFLCVVLHPLLLCASPYLEKKFISPVLAADTMPYHLLHRTVAWEAGILEKVHAMYAALPDGASELLIQGLFYEIWAALYRNMLQEQQPPFRSHHLSALKEMLAYLEQHYPDRLRLAEIAQAGHVGKTSCCAIFQEFLHQTPNACLTDCRLRKGTELLVSTDMTVMEICYEVGFSGASYFTETFRKAYGCSPRAYRQQKRGGLR